VPPNPGIPTNLHAVAQHSLSGHEFDLEIHPALLQGDQASKDSFPPNSLSQKPVGQLWRQAYKARWERWQDRQLAKEGK
jgi:hypothetical protein